MVQGIGESSPLRTTAMACFGFCLFTHGHGYLSCGAHS
jgi:hypothetical protein